MYNPYSSVSLGAAMRFSVLLLHTISSLFLLPSTASIDAITANHTLVDGNTLNSFPHGNFVLGFFSHNKDGDYSTPAYGSARYLGIWYGKIPVFTVVWTANPDNPVPSNSTGILKIGPYGDLQVLDLNRSTLLWSSGGPNGTAANRVAQLYDTGNLVLMERTGREEELRWQSADHPFDTLFRGMKLGWDLRSGLNRYLKSWGGEANYSFDLTGVPQPFIRTGNTTTRLGFWDGILFINRPITTFDKVFHYEYTANKDEVFYSVSARNLSNVGRLKLDPSGKLTRYLWDGDGMKWKKYWDYPVDQCDEYSVCGTFGVCTPDDAYCGCLPGFDNRRSDGLNIRDGFDRCTRRTPLDCNGKHDSFQVVPSLKLPDSWNAMAWPDIGLDQCGKKCLTNCSCTAYSLLNVANGTGCIMWFGGLSDIKAFSSGGLALHLRLAASDIHLDPVSVLSKPKNATGNGSLDNEKNKNKKIAAIVSVFVLAGVLVLAYIYYNEDMKNQTKRKKKGTDELVILESAKEYQLPSFPLATIITATADFHPENKLGQGAFGPVYRGMLPNGEQIAVKRLSKSSKQGLKEFSNEISLIVKLQHKNLVKLLGCCAQEEERILIYEFMPNKCLCSFIFDDNKCKSLDWKTRANIITGIARGVNYLHHDSRLRVVHRDLKVGNILLDEKMNPKISDFGTATILDQDIIKESTERVVGTFGYMSPEYVTDGVFSMKSDVYSFGVIVLEIVTGIKNKVFPDLEATLTLLGYAWKLWIEGDIVKLADSRICYPCPTYIFRCIHVALLCVQEDEDDRPEMFEVIIMLGSDSMELPSPKKPGFFTTISSNPKVANAGTRQASCSIAQITYTDMEAR